MNDRTGLRSETECARRLLRDATGRAHFVGVCGVGMAGLAFHLAARGFRVSGCDVASNRRMASWLEARGISVHRGHDPSHIRGVDWVVRSAAVRADQPEILAAAESGIPVLRRGAMLAALLAEFDSVAVSGTHGKTTVAAMTVHALIACGMQPSFCIGGESEVLGGIAGLGQGRIMVAEADESDGSLSCYSPDIAVISNIEFDHSEFFGDIESLIACFESMARKTRKRVIYCADDPTAKKLCSGLDKAFGYGFTDSADLRGHDYTAAASVNRFGVSLHGRMLGELALPVTGRHNALDALAACSVALAMRGEFRLAGEGLIRFKPVRRRFERIVENDDLAIISDYAHHPSEVAAMMESAKLLHRSRLIAVFQPHRFSRTRALAPAFPKAFEGVDELVLAPVYPAFESPVPGGSTWDLYSHFRRESGTKVSCARDLRSAWNYLRRRVEHGDGLLIVGAGNVARIGEWAEAEFRSHGRIGGRNEVERWETGLKELGLGATALSKFEPMAAKTTLQVGGESDIFASVGSESDLVRIVKWGLRNKVPVRVIGRGSNLLVSDLGVRGVVIRLEENEFGFIRENAQGRIVCGAATALQAVVNWSAERGKTGLSFLSGIPGSVGGAVRMNAGAWGSTIGEFVDWVRVLNTDGSNEVIRRDNMCFGYRRCDSLKGRVVVEVALTVKNGGIARAREELERIAEKRKWMRGLRSAGSVFKNPENDFAGRLIEAAGLKGFKVGGACVSERHANIFVTEAGATASDVRALIEIVRGKVMAGCGVALEKEIACLG